MTPHIVHYPVGDNPTEASLYYGETVIDALKGLLEKSVQMVCTSPPYWGLRSYGVEEQVWGGNPDCEHQWSEDTGYTGHRGNRGQVPQTKWKALGTYPQSTTPVDQSRCSKCGAWKGCLGLEDTPEEYVEHLVQVFQEVHRVLRDDGTVWLNLGDTYMSHPANDISNMGGRQGSRIRNTEGFEDSLTINHRPHPEDIGLKDKDLVGIPWRVALALQEAGWYLRSDIIWKKVNPMPESTRDRPTKAHEYIFLLSKKPHYFYDAEAIKEPYANIQSGNAAIFSRPTGSNDEIRQPGNTPPHRKEGTKNVYTNRGRNKRSVWTMALQPYPGAHFAVWPRALVEPMVKAGTSKKGACASCGAPWKRVASTTSSFPTSTKDRGHPSRYGDTESKSSKGFQIPSVKTSTATLGWEPTCKCGALSDVVPCVVMDIFSGSATTGMVAMKLGRNYIGLDLNEEYLSLAESRITGMKAPSKDVEDEPNLLLELFGPSED